MWDGNPRIAKPEESGDFQTIVNGPGCRPYIEINTPQQWKWKAYQCEPGEIHFPFPTAYRFEPGVVIEPGLKDRASPNKQWGGWDLFVTHARRAGITLTQLGPVGTRPLRGVGQMVTPDFRSACAVLVKARAYVGHEGGMMHAAAALGIPAVVIFGAYISPKVTGYESHVHFFEGKGLGCGMRTPCPCCVAAMARIQPQAVLNKLLEIL